MKYQVFGNTSVVVCVKVEAKSEEEAMRKAKKKFKGISSFAGNGGTDKLIGVSGADESIWSNDPVEFDDCMPE